MPNFPTFPTLGMGRFGPVAPGSGAPAAPEVLTADFGKRYSQRTGDGINSMVRDYSFKSTALREDKMRTLTDFLLARKGYLPFMFLVPGELVARQFICKQWNPVWQDQLYQVLTAQFEENFDP